MANKTDAGTDREIIAQAVQLVSTWPDWKRREFENLSGGEHRSNSESNSDVSKAESKAA